MSTSIFDRVVQAIEADEDKKFAKLIESSPQEILQQHPDTQYTLLHYAAKYDRVSMAEQLINAGVPLDLYPSKNYMPEHKGAGSGPWTTLC